jgi:hypothetical protein
MRYAVVRMEDNVVDNLILGTEDTIAPDNCYLIEIVDELWADLGWVWDGSQFINPNPVVEEPVVEEPPTE